MSNPNRVMAYVPKGESDYAVFPQADRAYANVCADYFRARGYKVRVTRFNVGPRDKRGYNWKVSVYYDSSKQEVPDAMGWKFGPGRDMRPEGDDA